MKNFILTLTFISIAVWTCPVSAIDLNEIKVHGFISQGYLLSDEYNYLANSSKDGSFEYRETGINFSSRLTDKLRVGMQFFARDLGDVANDKITLDWAYGDYRFKDWLGLRVGKVRLPIGLHNEIRDLDMLHICIVLPQGIYNDLLRDTLVAANGVSPYGHVTMGVAGGLDYQVMTGVINVDNESGVAKFTNNGFNGAATVNGDITNNSAYSGALLWDTPLTGLKLGYSILRAENDIPALFGGVQQVVIETVFTGQVFSAEYTWNKLILTSEYLTLKRDSKIGVNETSVTNEGYYLSASYAFTDWFTLGAYYSEYYPDKDDKEGRNQAIDHNAWQKDLALTLRFDINEYWILKVEGHSVDGTANVIKADNVGSVFSESNWYYGAAKITFNF